MARRKLASCADASCLHIPRPRLPVRREPPVDTIVADEDSVRYEGREIVGANAAGFDASRAELTDCEVVRCDLANVVWDRARLTRVAFVDCKLLGARFGEKTELLDVTFTRCVLDIASFDRASLARVAFCETTLRDASFGASHLDHVAFPRSDLSRSDLSGVVVVGGDASIDLRGALLAGVSLDARILRALVIHPEDAPAIASALGMKVVDGVARPSCATEPK